MPSTTPAQPTARPKCYLCDAPATTRLEWSVWPSKTPMCDEHTSNWKCAAEPELVARTRFVQLKE